MNSLSSNPSDVLSYTYKWVSKHTQPKVSEDHFNLHTWGMLLGSKQLLQSKQVKKLNNID